MFASLFTNIGSICSKAVTTFTWIWIADEPECPKTLIK